MEFNHKKLPSYIMVGTMVLVVIWFNISYFKNRISSNLQSISEYPLSDEDIATLADIATAGIFYPAEIQQKDKNNDGYIEEIKGNESYCPRIMVEPHYGLRRAGKVAADSYRRLLFCAKKIKNVFILAPLHNSLEGAVLPKETSVKTPLGDIVFNQSVISVLKKNSLFKVDQAAYDQENSWKIQLPYLQNSLSSFKVVPILYGNINAEKLASILLPYIKKTDVLLVVSADLGKHNNSFDSSVDDIHQSCGNTGIDTVLFLAKRIGLVPQLLENSSMVKYDPLVSIKGWGYEDVAEKVILSGLELSYSNLQNFVRHHKDNLLNIARNCLNDNSKKRCKIKRKHYNDYLFNRGASFVTLKHEGKVLASSGSIVASKAIAADIAENIHKAINSLDNKQYPSDKIDLSLQLLTDWEKVKFNTYKDVLRKIKPNIDGLVILSGDREGFMMPQDWQKFRDKEDFITELKIRAGLSPNYWSDDIKIFKFRTVEVK